MCGFSPCILYFFIFILFYVLVQFWGYLIFMKVNTSHSECILAFGYKQNKMSKHLRFVFCLLSFVFCNLYIL